MTVVKSKHKAQGSLVKTTFEMTMSSPSGLTDVIFDIVLSHEISIANVEVREKFFTLFLVKFGVLNLECLSEQVLTHLGRHLRKCC